MTLPSPNIIQAAQKAGRRMADRDTPFIENEWYVAAFADEIGRALFKRTLLDRRIVMYRTEAGQVVALDDRCAHRSYPLSAGTLEGDTVVCGYHGFRYDAQGNWIEIPSQPRCPKHIGVRAYPIVEKGPLVWIWMGQASLADPATLPEQDWISSPDWAWSKGYLHLPGNYVSLHENLVDLTHLSFLHIRSFGTPDYARAPFDVEITDSTFAVIRHVVPTKLPPIWARSTGLNDSPTAARIAKSAFLSPALHLTSVTFYESALPPEGRPEFHNKVAHILTPETKGSTHYFAVIGRDFRLDDTELQAFIHKNLYVAFQEDADAMALLEPILEDRDEDFYEVSVASDTAAVAMRRHLKARADAERSAEAAPALAAE